MAKNQFNKNADGLKTGPLKMEVTFFFKRPKSASKRIHHTVKPDLSNLVKSVEDALNGIVYVDDAQIVELSVIKVYDSAPGIEVFIEEI